MKLEIESIEELSQFIKLFSPPPPPPAPKPPERPVEPVKRPDIFINPGCLSRISWASQEVIHVYYSLQIDHVIKTTLNLCISEQVAYSVPLLVIPTTARVDEATLPQECTLQYLNPESAEEKKKSRRKK